MACHMLTCLPVSCVARTTILADEATTDDMMDRVEKFHLKFLSEHS